MRHKIYNFLVNRKEGIKIRYHKMHDGAMGAVRILSWFYLLWLNFAYYVLQMRFLGMVPELSMYEEKKLSCVASESETYIAENDTLDVEKFVERLSEYEVVSFDVFDTLIFRPFSQPTDVFYLIGDKLGIMDFKNIRMKAEYDARVKRREEHGDMEIGIADIWANIEAEVGISAEKGRELEEETERRLCYANPFMLAVWKRLADAGKRIIVVSDMYLSEQTIRGIIEEAGFVGAERIFISCEYHRSKADGRLFGDVLDSFGGKKPSIVHVGDNPHSDRKMALQYGFGVMPYPNVNKNMQLYRAFDMSCIVGSAYRAIVGNRLYCGTDRYSMEYEYGFIYGGLFVLGYCNFIHDYCKKNSVDKVLFLSRDGDILKKVYDYVYPGEATEYVYWSRKAATKLEAVFDRHDYFRRFIYHKANQNYTIDEVLKSMELDFSAEELRSSGLGLEDRLTNKNADTLRDFIESVWTRVIGAYSGQDKAARDYYGRILSGCHTAAAVDIGWAGSGAMVLGQLVAEEWDIPCDIVGIVAGTNTMYNAEPDASEPFLQSGKLVAYLYSQRHNRDLLKKHNPNKDYNVFWELLLSSPTPQFKGFYTGKEIGTAEDIYMSDMDITLKFGKYDANQGGIREIQRGILDFAADYTERLRDFPYMLNISGRDAYAPMLVAASHEEGYLRAIEKKFALEINVN